MGSRPLYPDPTRPQAPLSEAAFCELARLIAAGVLEAEDLGPGLDRITRSRIVHVAGEIRQRDVAAAGGPAVPLLVTGPEGLAEPTADIPCDSGLLGWLLVGLIAGLAIGAAIGWTIAIWWSTSP